MKVAKVNGATIAVRDSILGLGGSNPVPNLSDLGDVDLTGLSDGDVIAWDSGSGTWVVVSGSTIDALNEGVSLTTALASIDFVGAGVTATVIGDDVTVTIPGGTTATDTSLWRPLMDPSTGMIITDGTTGEAVMGFGPA